ncbi:MAG: tRNA (cytidine(56)-2'-O)-methyltransferase [Candidatus Verstraetearchaeota archaeon]|nr:tRNA (cytidine(56)-2'-O)-methyltransferase [Candidatus Verstraetearchaeota archaeon]
MPPRSIVVLRLGHRAFRDKRITTHVCLTARAFGASGVYISGTRDPSLRSSVEKIVRVWGGGFWVEFVKSPLKAVHDWKASGGCVAHLTMYGLPLGETVLRIPKEKDLLVVVGGEKVPPEYFSLSDFNIAVGSQPHSEVAAIAVFLDRVTGGRWENLKFENAKLRIVASERGKVVEELDK